MSRPFGEPLPPPLLDVVEPEPVAPEALPPRRGLMMRVLYLRHIRPKGWQRVVLGDLPLVVAVLLVLADLASAWVLIALPLAVGAMVVLHDVVAGRLARVGPAPAAAPEARGKLSRAERREERRDEAERAAAPPRPRAIRGSRG